MIAEQKLVIDAGLAIQRDAAVILATSSKSNYRN